MSEPRDVILRESIFNTRKTYIYNPGFIRDDHIDSLIDFPFQRLRGCEKGIEDVSISIPSSRFLTGFHCWVRGADHFSSIAI
jgi:hypothetical protein